MRRALAARWRWWPTPPGGSRAEGVALRAAARWRWPALTEPRARAKERRQHSCMRAKVRRALGPARGPAVCVLTKRKTTGSAPARQNNCAAPDGLVAAAAAGRSVARSRLSDKATGQPASQPASQPARRKQVSKKAPPRSSHFPFDRRQAPVTGGRAGGAPRIAILAMALPRPIQPAAGRPAKTARAPGRRGGKAVRPRAKLGELAKLRHLEWRRFGARGESWLAIW